MHEIEDIVLELNKNSSDLICKNANLINEAIRGKVKEAIKPFESVGISNLYKNMEIKKEEAKFKGT